MSDLLDLFRRSQSSGDDEKPKSRTAKSKAKRPQSRNRKAEPSKKKKRVRKRPTRAANDETVLTLTRRQMLYAGSGQVILLGLAFLVGLTFGRSGPELNRPEPVQPAEIYIVAEIPLTNGLGNQRPVNIREIVRRLTSIHDIDRRWVHTRKTERVYEIAIGKFDSEEAARRFVDAKRLGQFRAAGRLPFQKPRIGPIKR